MAVAEEARWGFCEDSSYGELPHGHSGGAHAGRGHRSWAVLLTRQSTHRRYQVTVRPRPARHTVRTAPGRRFGSDMTVTCRTRSRFRCRGHSRHLQSRKGGRGVQLCPRVFDDAGRDDGVRQERHPAFRLVRRTGRQRAPHHSGGRRWIGGVACGRMIRIDRPDAFLEGMDSRRTITISFERMKDWCGNFW